MRTISENNKLVKGLVDKLYGCSCSVCGYGVVREAIDYHHHDSSTKTMLFDKMLFHPNTVNLLQHEMNKCVVVCSNCHRGIHAGKINCPTPKPQELLHISLVYDMIAGYKCSNCDNMASYRKKCRSCLYANNKYTLSGLSLLIDEDNLDGLIDFKNNLDKFKCKFILNKTRLLDELIDRCTTRIHSMTK